MYDAGIDGNKNEFYCYKIIFLQLNNQISELCRLML